MNTHTAFRSVFGVSLGALAIMVVAGCGGISKGGSGDTTGGGSGGSTGGSDSSTGGSTGGSDSSTAGSPGSSVGGGGAGGTGGTVVGGAGGTDAGSGGTGGGCDPGCPGSPAIAMTWAQLEGASGSGSSSSSGPSSGTTTGSGPGVDPNTQYLLYGSGTETPACDAPYGDGSCGGWRVSISIAPGSFNVGVHPFAVGSASISFSESMDEGGGMCSGGGGGGFDEGQIEILDITPSAVHFIVSGVDTFFSFSANGEFLASRCP